MNSVQTVWFSFLMGIVFLVATSIASGEEVRRFPEDRIEQLVAPIALYPDALLAQVLMAATYPSEVVQAARWARRHQKLSVEELQDALEDKPWDPSVKSLVAFPGLLSRMEGEQEWMEDLGNAFLDQQNETMDAIQRMRARARAAGHLMNTPQQRVKTKGKVIDIQPTQPDAVYVPIYNPTLVYGDDLHYPTVYYPRLYAQDSFSRRSSDYSTESNLLTFGMGAVVGVILFSQFDWNNRQIIVNHQSDRHRSPQEANGPTRWWHDPSRRQGTRYHDSTPDQRYEQERVSPRGEWSRDEPDLRQSFRRRNRLDVSEDGDRGDRGERPRRESFVSPYDAGNSQQHSRRDRPSRDLSEDADRGDRGERPRRESFISPSDADNLRQRSRRDRPSENVSEDADQGARGGEPHRKVFTFSSTPDDPQQRPDRNRPSRNFSEGADRGSRDEKPRRESAILPPDTESASQHTQHRDHPLDVPDRNQESRAEKTPRVSVSSRLENPQQRAEHWGRPPNVSETDPKGDGESPHRQPSVVRPIREVSQPVGHSLVVPRGSVNQDNSDGRPLHNLPISRSAPENSQPTHTELPRSPLRPRGGKELPLPSANE